MTGWKVCHIPDAWTAFSDFETTRLKSIDGSVAGRLVFAAEAHEVLIVGVAHDGDRSSAIS